MVTYAPKLENSGFVPEGPTVVSGAGAAIGQGLADFGSIAGKITGALTPERPEKPAAETEAARKRGAAATLTDAFDQSIQLGEQGYNVEAANVVRKASLNYIRDYGRDDSFEDIAALYSVAAPSIDFMDVQAERMRSITSDPNFATAFSAVKYDNPGISDTDAIQAAAGKIDEMRVEEARLNRLKAKRNNVWAGETEGAFTSTLNTFVSSNLGGLQIKEAGGSRITIDDVQQLRFGFEALKFKLSKPSSISADDYSSFNQRLTNLDSLITTMEGMPEAKLSALRTEQSLKFFELVTGSVANPLAVEIILGDTDVWGSSLGTGLIQMALKDITKKSVDSVGSSFNYFGDQTVAANPSDVKEESDDGLYPEEISTAYKADVPLGVIKGNFEAANLILPGKVASSDAKWRATAETVYAAAAKSLAGADGRVSAAGMKGFFNQGLYNSLTALDKADPEMSTRVRTRFLDSIGPQQTMNRARLDSVLKQGPLTGDGIEVFSYDRETGKLSVNLEEFQNMGGTTYNTVKGVVDTYYGGDATKAFNDPTFARRIEATNVVSYRTLGLDTWKEANKMAASIATVDDISNRLSLNPAPKAPVVDKPVGEGAKSKLDRVKIDNILKSPTESTPTELARAFVGASETTDGKVLSEFFNKYGGQKLSPSETAWCAAMANSVLEATGFKGSGSLAARSFLNVGEKIDSPKEGDIAVFWREDPNSWKGHVGFYAGEETVDGQKFIKVLGGNQGDEMSIQSYPAEKLLGYRRPQLKQDKANIKTDATPDFPSDGRVIAAGIPLPTAEQAASIAVGVKDTVLPGIKSLADAVENLSSGKIDLTPISAIQLIRGVVYPGYTMTTKDFSKSEIAALSSAVDKATAKGRKMITYEDYGSGIKGNNIIQSQSILTTMYDSITNPAKRAALVVGNAKIDRRSDGSVWIVDKYDFHPKDSKKFNTAMSNGEYAAAYDLLKNQSSGTMALELVSAYAIQFGVGEPQPFSIMVKPPTNGETGSETTTARMPVSRPGTTGNSDPAPETSPQPRGRGEEDRPFLPGILNAPDTRG